MDRSEGRYEGLLRLVERVLETRSQVDLLRVMVAEFADLGVTHFRLLHCNPVPIGGTRFVDLLSTVPDALSMRNLAARYPQIDEVMFPLLKQERPIDARNADAGALQDLYIAMRDEHTALLGKKAFLAVPVFRGDDLEGLAIFLFGKPDELALAESLAFRVLAKAAFEQLRALRSPDVAAPECPLTARQRQVLALCAHGKSDWDIASVMGLGQSTVHGYIEEAKKRLGVKTRIQAVIVALRYGWIVG